MNIQHVLNGPCVGIAAFLLDGRIPQFYACFVPWRRTIKLFWQTTVPHCQEGVSRKGSDGDRMCNSALGSCHIVTDIDDASIGIYYRVMQEKGQTRSGPKIPAAGKLEGGDFLGFMA